MNFCETLLNYFFNLLLLIVNNRMFLHHTNHKEINLRYLFLVNSDLSIFLFVSSFVGLLSSQPFWTSPVLPMVERPSWCDF